MADIRDYDAIVGAPAIDDLFWLAERLGGRSIVNVNSTSVGGGVAEILFRMIPLMRQLGVDASWEVIKGDDNFFRITKKIHNGIHGVPVQVSDEELDWFRTVNRENAETMRYGDTMFIHDPQPIGLVEKRSSIGGRWAWRCHVDISRPVDRVWHFLGPYIRQYDAAVFSAPAFARDLPIPQVLIAPSIDPLSDKNKDLPEETITAVFDRFGIDRSRPIVTQISRFDRLKDPLGVIEAYRIAKRHVDLQLVLAGGGAPDDPEGPAVMKEVTDAAEKDHDIFVLLLPPNSDVEINALQRGSTVVLQKSRREGFGLTVSEALWKGRPVIASAVGGIPLQVLHRFTGILTHSVEGTAHWIRQLINEPDFARGLGANGREHVKAHFLITRHVKDYLLLFNSVAQDGDVAFL
jgi:trehalose synthase